MPSVLCPYGLEGILGNGLRIFPEAHHLDDDIVVVDDVLVEAVVDAVEDGANGGEEAFLSVGQVDWVGIPPGFLWVFEEHFEYFLGHSLFIGLTGILVCFAVAKVADGGIPFLALVPESEMLGIFSKGSSEVSHELNN